MSTFGLNYMLQDIIGATFAFALFPLVLVIPGYVAAWAWDIFDFRRQQTLVRLGIGLVLSLALSPILFDLTSSLLSFGFSMLVIGGFAIAFVVIIVREKKLLNAEAASRAKPVLWICGAWAVFTILSLVDIQWEDRLYFSVVSFDQTSRVSVINAMTRTGVPPINPGYYPGEPVRLNFLYYFWYILASLVDQIGGTIVDSRAALNASSIWAGLGLAAVITLYIRMRNAGFAVKDWISAKVGVALLAVSGLDILPSLIFLAGVRYIYGTVESWNSQMEIPTWISSILWAPHHIAALVAGMVAVMIVFFARNQPTPRKFTLMAVAGAAFASSLGLSVWVTLLFSLFWGAWIITFIIRKEGRDLILGMVFSGIVAILLASPFILGLLKTGSDGGTGQSPIIFDIRSLYLLEVLLEDWNPLLRSLLMLALLPMNYFLELGFFYAVGFYWFERKNKAAITANQFYLAETILMAVVVLTGSTLRSTITNNDLGWRVWLPGQFVLLIWSADIIRDVFSRANDGNSSPLKSPKTKNLLIALMCLGVLTTSVDAFFLRITLPYRVDPQTAERGYYARQTYEYLNNHVPGDVIIQDNPLNSIDRPGGLYGTHQMVIADRTAYGVPPAAFRKFANEIGSIFESKDARDWQGMDRICQQYLIDVLILNDTNPVWDSLGTLKTQRSPIYENPYYALFACGNYAENMLP